MYGKIFSSMYDGTLYGHWQAIVAFQQFIVLCNADGVVDMTPQAIAARTSIPLEIIQEGIKILEQPDPYTRTPGEDGKRIVLLDDHRPWGWRIVNHQAYRDLIAMEDKRKADRERLAAKRATSRIVSQPVAESREVSHEVANVAHADADADADADASKRRTKRASRAPEVFTPDLEFARATIPDLDAEAEAQRFKDHEFKSAKSDWSRVWRNWVRTCRDTGRYAKKPSASTTPGYEKVKW